MSTYRRYGEARQFPSHISYPVAAQTALTSDREMKEGLDLAPLKTLTKPTVASATALQLKNIAYVGSYNWIEATKPTIIVPGAHVADPFRVLTS